jgi:hypothetical protein
MRRENARIFARRSRAELPISREQKSKERNLLANTTH